MLSVIILALFSCNGNTENVEKNSSTNNTKQEQIVQVQESFDFEYLTDSTLNQIIVSRSKWFESWKWNEKTLKIDDFKIDWEKDTDIKWIEYNPQDAYVKQYDSLLIQSEGKLALDLYSYNTLIEHEGASVLVEFDVDFKPYIVDKTNGLRAEITTGGSYEIIEDGLWLDDKRIVLLGYLHENENTPFLWLIDIDAKKQVAYNYLNSFVEARNNYFFTKYPSTKLRTE